MRGVPERYVVEHSYRVTCCTHVWRCANHDAERFDVCRDAARGACAVKQGPSSG